MAEIVLATLNAKYIHAAFGLRYLLANLGGLRERAAIREFDINQRPNDVAEALLGLNPRIIGLGVYIWNVAVTTQLVRILKRLRPELTIILGGPEVSYEADSQSIVEAADHVLTGEADLELARVCAVLLEGGKVGRKVVACELPQLSDLRAPYELYTDEDLAHRITYVEASRGCPFKCEFCLSSLDIPVRQAPLPSFLEQLELLLKRGARQLKFVDRTFNLDIRTSRTILEFLLDRWQPGRLFHFEVVPDLLRPELRELIARFPPGAVQLEAGIQTFSEEVAARISRRQNLAAVETNLRFVRQQTGAHLHVDLIVGLPGESLESFAQGFDRAVALNPHEIQVGILKRLRGTPIGRHAAQWGMVFNPDPPYEILQTSLIDFTVMQRLRRFARYWDVVANSGNFLETLPLLWRGNSDVQSPFLAFLAFSDWLYGRTRRTDAIALSRLMELVFKYLTVEVRLEAGMVAPVLWRDYQRGGRRDKPDFLRPWLLAEEPVASARLSDGRPKRQARHHRA